MTTICVCTFQVQLSQEELQRIITETKEELGYVGMFFLLLLFYLSSNFLNVILVIVISMFVKLFLFLFHLNQGAGRGGGRGGR